MMQNTKLFILATSLVGLSHTAMAQENLSMRGEAGIGVNYENGAVVGEDFSVPLIDAGGKLAIETLSGIGLQLDGNFEGASLEWFKPDLGVDGHVRDFAGVAHLIYGPRSDVRFGIYGGYERVSLGINDIDLSDFLDTNRLFNAAASASFWSAGMEAQLAIDASNLIEARLGYLNPYAFTLEGNDGFTSESITETDSDNELWGWQAGLGFETKLSSNVSLRADASYIRYVFEDEGHLNLFTALLGAKYSFDTLPLSLKASAGLGHIAAEGDSDTELLASIGLVWNFGAQANGLNDGFFHSVSALGTVN